MISACGFRFEIFNEDSAIVFSCSNRVGCDGNPHRATVESGGYLAVIRFSETRNESSSDRRKR